MRPLAITVSLKSPTSGASTTFCNEEFLQVGVVFWKNTKVVGCDLTDSSLTVVVVFPALLYQSNEVQSLN